MPDVETQFAANYIIGLLYECGLMSPSGMGPLPIGWCEIDAWLRLTERELTLWERLLIKQLSEEYVSELSQASDKNRPAPYDSSVVDGIDRNVVENKLRGFLKGFMSSRKK